MKKKNKIVRKTHLIKRRGLRRVCAALCLCFGLSAVVLPFVGSRGGLTVSANSTTVSAPSNCYVVSVSRPPCFYVDWANAGLITSLTATPVIYIAKDGYYMSFGDTLIKINVSPSYYHSDNEVPDNYESVQVPFFQTADGSTAMNPICSDKFMICAYIDPNAPSANDLYQGLIEGVYTIFYVGLDIRCTNDSSSQWYNRTNYNIFIYKKATNELEYNINFNLIRRNNTNPYPSDWVDYSYTSGSDSWFSYVVTYNGIGNDNQSYNQGYTEGKKEGYESGYDIGLKSGRIEGFENGYNAGISEKLENITPWQQIVYGVNSFFDLELLPGVKFSVILSVAFGLILLGFVIKIFLGG